MKKILGILLLFILTSCGDVHKPVSKPIVAKPKTSKKLAADTAERSMVQYSDQQLEIFLDSVGRLPTQPLADKVSFGADSVFKSPKQCDTLISPRDIKILKRAIKKGVMSVKTARRIFNNNEISYDCTEKSIFLTYKHGLIPVVYYPFDLSKGEYGICIGEPGHCQNALLYFFKGNKVIAVHNYYDRFSPPLKYFKDADGETVIYYAIMFNEGSGIGWFNYYFYKYDDNKLIPVLNELQNANLLQPSPWCVRELWLESTIQKTNPLTIKMVYHQELPDTAGFDHHTGDSTTEAEIVNDSTVIQYSWNQRTKTFEGAYNQSKITKLQILSYYLVDNELLFINCYHHRLKELLQDKTKRAATLHYLNLVKNHYGKRQS